MHEILKKITTQRINQYCSQGLAIRVGLQNPTVAAVSRNREKALAANLAGLFIIVVRLGRFQHFKLYAFGFASTSRVRVNVFWPFAWWSL